MINPTTLPPCKSSTVLAENLNKLNNRKLSNKILSLIEDNKITNKHIEHIPSATVRNILAELWMKESKKRIETLKQYTPDMPKIVYTTTNSIITGLYRDILRQEK